MRAIVGRVEHDRVVGDPKILERLEHGADVGVVLDHTVAVFVLARLAKVGLFHMRAEVHPRGVPPAEEGLA